MLCSSPQGPRRLSLWRRSCSLAASAASPASWLRAAWTSVRRGSLELQTLLWRLRRTRRASRRQLAWALQRARIGQSLRTCTSCPWTSVSTRRRSRSRRPRAKLRPALLRSWGPRTCLQQPWPLPLRPRSPLLKRPEHLSRVLQHTTSQLECPSAAWRCRSSAARRTVRWSEPCWPTPTAALRPSCRALWRQSWCAGVSFQSRAA
mmetsp:Transcript_15888/g.41012  ORF Transcript_15888/g.41012 Transcript_15888/m.41012 type:complete len:205 (+) Transcript_15888:471-1085(+)